MGPTPVLQPMFFLPVTRQFILVHLLPVLSLCHAYHPLYTTVQQFSEAPACGPSLCTPVHPCSCLGWGSPQGPPFALFLFLQEASLITCLTFASFKGSGTTLFPEETTLWQGGSCGMCR